MAALTGRYNSPSLTASGWIRTMSSAWIDFLAQNASIDRDSLTFSDERADVKLAATASVAVPLTHLGLIRASGEDAAELLHNLLSSDIRKLKDGEAVRSSYSTPKGRMLADFLVWRTGEDILLQCARELAAPLARKLSMYVLRAKAKIADVSEEFAAIGLAGPAAPAWLATLGLNAPEAPMTLTEGQALRLDADRFMLISDAASAPALWQKLVAAGAAPAGSAAWHYLDIEAGIPLITAATQDEFVAQMVNFERIGGVDFRKGCYTGQEIIARMQYRGTLKKRMYRAHVAGDVPAPGTELFASDFGDQPAGKVICAVPAPEGGAELLACVPITSHDQGEVRLANGEVLAFGELPYSLA